MVSDNEITALNINSKESLWIDHHRGWRTADTDKDSGLSESKLLSHVNSSQSNYNNSDGGTDYAEVDTRNLTTFYNCRKVSSAWSSSFTKKVVNSNPYFIEPRQPHALCHHHDHRHLLQRDLHQGHISEC